MSCAASVRAYTSAARSLVVHFGEIGDAKFGALGESAGGAGSSLMRLTAAVAEQR